MAEKDKKIANGEDEKYYNMILKKYIKKLKKFNNWNLQLLFL